MAVRAEFPGRGGGGLIVRGFAAEAGSKRWGLQDWHSLLGLVYRSLGGSGKSRTFWSSVARL